MENYVFSRAHVLNALLFWKFEKFNDREKAILLDALVLNESFDYGEDDIDSLILELVSEGS